MLNVTTVTFSGQNRYTVAASLWQYDYGQILQIEGLELPSAYEVHFATSERGSSITMIGTDDGVLIPDEMLLSAGTIYAYIYLHEGESDGETEYKITIPVKVRAKPTDEQPTPVQQSAIDQAIAALNAAVEQTAEDVVTTGENAEAAAQAAETATQAAQSASTSESNALSYAQRAESAESNASASAQAAAVSERNAKASEESAEESADRAEQAAASAGYLDVEIVDGRLIYIRTDQVDVDFSLEDGHLIMEAV